MLCLTKATNENENSLSLGFAETFKWTRWVLDTLAELKPSVVTFTGVPTNFRRSTSAAETQEWVEPVSQSASAFEFSEPEDTSTNATGRIPFAVSSQGLTQAALFAEVVFVLVWVDGDRSASLGGKTFSAPWRSTLWVLSQSCFGHFLALWHFRKVWLPCKQEKQSFCSATYLALCVAFFSLNTEQFQSACCPLHSEHGGNLVFSLLFSSLELTLVLPASTFVTTFCLTGCSTLTKDFNRSWPSALFLSQSLKSSNVNRCQCCLTVCMDHASFRFVGSLLTAWLNRFTLFNRHWTTKT